MTMRRLPEDAVAGNAGADAGAQDEEPAGGAFEGFRGVGPDEACGRRSGGRRREGEEVALADGGGLVEPGAEAGQGVFAGAFFPGAPAGVGATDQEGDDGQAADPAPVDAGQVVHEGVDGAASFAGEAGGFPVFGGRGQFAIEVIEDGGDIELEEGGIGADGAADIDGSGKGGIIGGFDGLQVIGADFGHLGEVAKGQTLRFTSGAELFGHRGHGQEIADCGNGRPTKPVK